MPVVGAVALVGPSAVRIWSRAAGLVAVPTDLVEAAITGIDDEFTLVGDDVVPVAEVWREIFAALGTGSVGPLVLVCPSWWHPRRLEAIHTAAQTTGLEALRRSRSVVLAKTIPRRPAIVIEVGEDLVAVSRGQDHPVWAEAYECDDLTSTAAAVAQVVTSLEPADAAVIVDCGAGATHAMSLAETIAVQLRPRIATVGGDDRVLQAAARTFVPGSRVPKLVGDESSRVLPARRLALVAGAALTVAVTIALPRDHGDATTLVVSGRVVVEVPSGWHVQRTIDGLGAPRLEVISPSDREAAVHVRQSLVPPGETLAATADALRGALADEPAGVFVDFNDRDSRGGRPAVTYREVRRGHDVAWAVLVEGALRIAIGCQAVRGREETTRAACERAVASARDVFKSAGTDSASSPSNST